MSHYRRVYLITSSTREQISCQIVISSFFSASFAQECDDTCDLMLLQTTPKLQREILKYPKLVEESVRELEKAALALLLS